MRTCSACTTVWSVERALGASRIDLGVTMNHVTDKSRKQRLSPAAREILTAQVVREYRAGASIRTLSSEYNMSFGFIRGLLVEADEPLRGRGGDVRGRGNVKG